MQQSGLADLLPSVARLHPSGCPRNPPPEAQVAGQQDFASLTATLARGLLRARGRDPSVHAPGPPRPSARRPRSAALRRRKVV